MATQIVISNKDYVLVDDDLNIKWEDRGNGMPDLPHGGADSIHYMIWNTLQGHNEVQKCDGEGNMTGNVNLDSVNDIVHGTTTVQNLLDWGETRKTQIETAIAENDAAYLTSFRAHVDGGGSPGDHVWTKTWVDYDPDPTS